MSDFECLDYFKYLMPTYKRHTHTYPIYKTEKNIFA